MNLFQVFAWMWGQVINQAIFQNLFIFVCFAVVMSSRYNARSRNNLSYGIQIRVADIVDWNCLSFGDFTCEKLNFEMTPIFVNK